jgi:16S rRNA processing protein RimM
MEASLLQAGEIVSAHGVRGEVKILPWADGPEFLLPFETLYLQGQPRRVEFSRVHKSCVLCKLEGVDDAAAATALRGQVVSIDRSGLALPEGSVFIADLIGLTAVDEAGGEIGTVRQVIPMPAGDVLVIRGEKEYMVPNVRAFVKEIDLESRRIQVSLIEGMETDAD